MKVLVVGAVRNCAKQIENDITRLRQALAGAEKISWLLVESDSNDSTLSVLQALTTKIEGLEYISLGELRGQLPLRTQRIAHCRNIYLSEIRNSRKYSDIDYVIVSDFDGMNLELTRSAIESCWTETGWDVCTANQDGPYYDIWALRHPHWSPNDCFDQFRFLTSMRMATFKAYYSSVYFRMVKIPSNSRWIPVDSAFGGLAIYRRDVIVQGEYVGLTEDGKELCEHVSLHQSLTKKGFRIYINPKLINTKSNGHAFRVLIKTLALAVLGERGFEKLKAFARKSPRSHRQN